jgi:hypothetical protein
MREVSAEQSVAANAGITSRLQSARLVAAVAELGSLRAHEAADMPKTLLREIL